MANIIKLGSCYLNGSLAPVGRRHVPGQEILIGNTYMGQEISWVVVDRTLVADRCVLINVSWDDLNAYDLILGKKIFIDGFSYMIMAPNAESAGHEMNEWESFLGTVGDESNELWHWKGTYFWGKDISPNDPNYRVVRGYYSAQGWSYSESSNRQDNIGFRPILRPVCTEFTPKMPPYSELFLWIGQSLIHGRLSEITEYDLIVVELPGSHISDEDINQIIMQLPDGRLIVDQSKIKDVQRKVLREKN